MSAPPRHQRDTAESPAARLQEAFLALDAALGKQRDALLRGDGEALSGSLETLASLVQQAQRLDERLGTGGGSAGPQDVARLALVEDADTRRALGVVAARVRASALDNARLLVRARDLTGRLLQALEHATPGLDREA